MKNRSTLVLVLTIVTVLLLSSISLVAAQDEPIKIGLGYDLTGAESSLDLPAANGSLLAIKEINAAGGVLGRQIEGVSHDTRYDMALTAQIAQQFVEQDNVVAVVGFSDSELGAGGWTDRPRRGHPLHHGRRDFAAAARSSGRSVLHGVLRRQRPSRRRR